MFSIHMDYSKALCRFKFLCLSPPALPICEVLKVGWQMFRKTYYLLFGVFGGAGEKALQSAARHRCNEQADKYRKAAEAHLRRAKAGWNNLPPLHHIYPCRCPRMDPGQENRTNDVLAEEAAQG
jgi:hypothetical protein